VLVGIPDDLCDSRKGGEFLRGPLGVASSNHDASLRIFTMNAADGGPGVLIGGSSDRAGIQDHDLGVRGCRSSIETVALELAFDGRTIGLRRTAAKILYVKSCHHTIVAARSGLSGSGTDTNQKLPRAIAGFARAWSRRQCTVHI